MCDSTAAMKHGAPEDVLASAQANAPEGGLASAQANAPEDVLASAQANAPEGGQAPTPAPEDVPADTKPATPGIFITFEGGEGAGKSTHIAFLAFCLRELGYEVLCLREPGGTAIGEQLRAIVLDPKNDCLDAHAELFIYEAARAQIVSQVISPALARGAVVLCDRFYDSTVAYQAAGRGLSAQFIHQANAFACQGIEPQRTILMVSSTTEEGLERATNEGADRIERAGVDFHTRVNAAFLEIARNNPQRVRVVSFAESKAETAKRVFDQVKDLIPGLEQAAAANNEYFQRAENKELYKKEQ